MVKETATCGIDPISAATEIYFIQIEFEDLVLGEFGFHSQCKNDLANFAAKLLVAVQIDVACQLLRDGRTALRPATFNGPHIHGPRNPNGVDTGVHIITAVFDGDHRVLHFGRQLVDGQPTSETRTKRLNDSTVCRTDADHLPVRGGFQIFKTVNFAACYRDKNAKNHDAQQRRDDARFDHAEYPCCHWTTFFRNLARACHGPSVTQSRNRRQAPCYSGSNASAALLMQ